MDNTRGEAAPLKIRFVYGDERADTPLGRIERQNLGPSLIQTSVKHFSVSGPAVTEELKSEPLRTRVQNR